MGILQPMAGPVCTCWTRGESWLGPAYTLQQPGPFEMLQWLNGLRDAGFTKMDSELLEVRTRLKSRAPYTPPSTPDIARWCEVRPFNSL